MIRRCHWQTLLDYWLGEIGGDEERQLDAHLLGCDACSRRLQELVDLGGGIRSLGAPGRCACRDQRKAAGATGEKKGARIREYRSSRRMAASTARVAPEDDLLVARLQAPLAGVKRLDLVLIDIEEAAVRPGLARFHSIPVSDAVILMPQIDEVRRQPAHRARMRLMAVSGAASRSWANMSFNHSPWQAPQRIRLTPTCKMNTLREAKPEGDVNKEPKLQDAVRESQRGG